MSRKVWVHGVTGKVGKILKQKICDHKDFDFIGGSSSTLELSGIEDTQCIIDFSGALGTKALLEKIKDINFKSPLAILICSTGQGELVNEEWESFAQDKHKLMIAPNTSVGVLLVNKILPMIKSELGECFDIEIIETHHKHKVDIPSGTANLFAQTLSNDISTSRDVKRKKGRVYISSVRGGNIFGEHIIRFISESEEVSISHTAFSRELFADGALQFMSHM